MSFASLALLARRGAVSTARSSSLNSSLSTAIGGRTLVANARTAQRRTMPNAHTRPQSTSSQGNGNAPNPRSSGSSNASKKEAEAAATEESNMKTAYYMAAGALFVFGLSYASVPLYKVFCSLTGFGGTTQVASEEKARSITPLEDGKIVKVYFTASVHSAMPWKFRPTQKEVKVVPGETALAFYTVKNTADFPVTGIATYNVHPPKAGLYFNKIQCFCFEEQRLDAHEEIDMPVFFFIDPEFADDPAMESVNNITLSYTFFKTGEEEKVETEPAAAVVVVSEKDKAKTASASVVAKK